MASRHPLPDNTAIGDSPFTDSPWFWLYLFVSVGLIILALFSPKYAARQAQIERQFEGRSRSAAGDQNVQIDALPLEGPRVTLQPLFFGLAGVTVVAWMLHWRRQKRHAVEPRGKEPARQ